MQATDVLLRKSCVHGKLSGLTGSQAACNGRMWLRLADVRKVLP
jgi:hypothetical protein